MTNNTNILWLGLIAWAAGGTWWHVCKIKQLCDAPLVNTSTGTSPPAEVAGLRIEDGSRFSLTAQGNFGFARSGSSPNYAPVRKELDSLAAYLKANPGKKVNITGYHTSGEVNNTMYPDLGTARAENLKACYIAKGLPADMFITHGVLQEKLTVVKDSIRGGIDFSIADAETSADTLAKAQTYKSIFKPLDVYFKTGGSQYIRTPDNSRFVKDAVEYLAGNKDKKLLLTGHADNSGDPSVNLGLSRKRAEQVKNELIAAGIAQDQLVVSAKGQTAPKMSNDTPEGRAANRRVEIVVQ